MTIKRHKIKLRDPDFLLWLGQFVGEWTLEGPVEISRRDDGFLEALSIDRQESIPLGMVIEQGKFVKAPKSPLGPYPVALSFSLMEHWLLPEDMKRLQGAWNVGRGIKHILETIEQRIKELPKSERDHRWLQWWKGNASSVPSLSPDELKAHRMLYGIYKSGAAMPMKKSLK